MQQPAGWMILSLMPIAITPTLFLAVGGMVELTKIFTFAPTRQPCRRRGIGGQKTRPMIQKAYHNLPTPQSAGSQKQPSGYQESPKQASDAKQVNGVFAS